MSTYDLTTTTPSSIKTGDILNCPYSGSYKSITLPKGQYKLECWGAQGGSYNTSYYGGKGGYSVGILNLSSNKTTIYLYTSGAGTANTSSTNTTTYLEGGFNGGGKGVRASGGGASDIRIGQDSLYARVIVAGGGGGCAYYNTTDYGQGGSGGGLNGQSGLYQKTTNNTSKSGQGGSQTGGGAAGSSGSCTGTAGTFGVGGNSGTASGYFLGGGGGGWYGGGGNSDSEAGGGGGSGYVYTSSTASNYPSGCLLNSSHYLTSAQTIAGTESFTSPTGTSETGHSSNGYIRITVIKVESLNMPVNIGGSWKDATSIYVNIGGAWKTGEAVYVNIGGTWKQQ